MEEKKSTYTPAQKRALKKHAEKIDRLSITVPAGKRDTIKDHAARQGESVNAFVTRAIDETIDRDNLRQGS